ncbi:transposase [Chitinophaga agrisoli]|uniref:Transposase n=1 Tax=Chitinophaga agrisoli TaxID=2607653 RepID=A0A5B2VQP1_9BACT|nr:transposase [Chitinophaga agrisoli]
MLEVTIDMSASLNVAIKRCFPNAHRVIDRFHV